MREEVPTRTEGEKAMNFEKIAEYLNLGSMTDSPKKVSGGLLHKMYAVSTATGTYAVKVLNR